MDKDSLLDDMEVQFAEEDRAAYGDGWYTYSELAIITMRAHDLMKLEAQIGVPIAAVMDQFRTDATFANLAAAWIATGHQTPFKDFNPMIMQADWRTRDVEAGKSPSLPVSSASEIITLDTAPPATGDSPTKDSSASPT